MAPVAKTDIAEMEMAIYDESFRTISEQAQVLDGLRNRAGGVAAVANVATAFLGGLALGDSSAAALGILEWLAIGLFCATLATSLAILVPSRRWASWHHPHDLLAVYLDPVRSFELSEFRRDIAYDNGRHYERNGTRLTRLAVLLWAASMSLTLEIVLWLMILAR